MMNGLIFAVAMLLSTAAVAQDRDFTLVNNTGYAIKGVFVNLPGDNVFNENELSSPLADGARFRVKFTPADGNRACVWNIKVDWADGSAASFFNRLNLCNIENVYLRYNRATDVTSFTTD